MIEATVAVLIYSPNTLEKCMISPMMPFGELPRKGDMLVIAGRDLEVDTARHYPNESDTRQNIILTTTYRLSSPEAVPTFLHDLEKFGWEAGYVPR